MKLAQVSIIVLMFCIQHSEQWPSHHYYRIGGLSPGVVPQPQDTAQSNNQQGDSNLGTRTMGKLHTLLQRIAR